MNRYQFFTVSASCSDAANTKLNDFLIGHRIIAVEKHFVADGANSFWSFCVTYTEDQEGLSGRKKGQRQRVDYRELLSEDEFSIYARLRELRNQLAKKEGVAPYLVFNNEQLARMVQNKVRSKAALLEISGVGQARVDKYSQEFLPLLQELFSEKNHGETTPHNPVGNS